MDRRKFPNLVLALVVIASLLVGASGAAFAAVPAPEATGSAFEREVTPQDELSAAPAPPDPMEKWQKKIQKEQEKKAKRIKPADRKAAADRAAAKGFALPEMGTAAAAAAAALPGEAPHYFSHPNYANSPYPVLQTAGTCSVTTAQSCSYNTDCPAAETCVGATFTGGIRKFVDPLPWGPGGSPMPVAVGQTIAGAPYYEIGLVQYRQKMHTDLAGPTGKGTLLRGYVELKDCAAGGVPLVNEMLDGTAAAHRATAARPSPATSGRPSSPRRTRRCASCSATCCRRGWAATCSSRPTLR